MDKQPSQSEATPNRETKSREGAENEISKSRSFKLAMAQMLVEGGDLDGNLARAGQRIRTSAENGADIVQLPEVMDLGWTHSSAKTMAYPVPGGKTFEALASAARDNSIYVVAGIIEKDGDRTYNTAVLISRSGELLLKHRKLNELDIAHDLYDQGDRLNVMHTDLGTIGLLVCADANVKDFALQRSLGYMGADIILSPSAWAVPPEHNNETDPYGGLWRGCYGPVAKEFQMWIISVSNVGLVSEGPWKDWYCIGSSLAFDAYGKEVLQAPYGRTADTIIYVDVNTHSRPARGTEWGEYWGKGQ
jgi:predicted amidohydrolase